MRIGICQWHPPTLWRHGGGEVQARKYHEHLNRIDGVEAVFFSPSEPQQIDILHIIGTNYHLNEIGKYARAQGIKVAITPIAYSRHAPWKFRLILGALSAARMRTPLLMRREILHEADLVLACTNVERRFLIEAYGLPKDNIDVVGIGAEIETFANADPAAFREAYGVSDFVLSVGRVNSYKNQLQILEALEPASHPVVIIGAPDGGEPEYESAITEIIRKKGWLWIQGLPNDSNLLASAYAASRCHVVFSRGETAGIVNLEAMASGTIVITKPHETVAELVGSHGLYASTNAELRAAADRAYSDDPALSQMAREGRERVLKDFSWASMAEKLAQKFERLTRE